MVGRILKNTILVLTFNPRLTEPIFATNEGGGGVFTTPNFF